MSRYQMKTKPKTEPGQIWKSENKYGRKLVMVQDGYYIMLTRIKMNDKIFDFSNILKDFCKHSFNLITNPKKLAKYTRIFQEYKSEAL